MDADHVTRMEDIDVGQARGNADLVLLPSSIHAHTVISYPYPISTLRHLSHSAISSPVIMADPINSQQASRSSGSS